MDKKLMDKVAKEKMMQRAERLSNWVDKTHEPIFGGMAKGKDMVKQAKKDGGMSEMGLRVREGKLDRAKELSKNPAERYENRFRASRADSKRLDATWTKEGSDANIKSSIEKAAKKRGLSEKQIAEFTKEYRPSFEEAYDIGYRGKELDDLVEKEIGYDDRYQKKSFLSKVLGSERGSIGPQGSAEKNAESTAPKKRNTMKPNEKPMKSATFSSMERDLPKGGGKTMKIAKELDPDDAMKATIKKMMPGNKLGKALKRTGIAAMVGGPIGLGVNALMESLDAEEGGSEEERLDEVAMDQEMKTEAKIKADKAKAKSLPASTKKSYPTKEKVKALPQNVKKTVVEKRAPMPMGKSDKQKMEEFNQEGRRNIPDWKIEGMDDAVERAMRSEFKKAAKESNKKPLSTYIKR